MVFLDFANANVFNSRGLERPPFPTCDRDHILGVTWAGSGGGYAQNKVKRGSLHALGFANVT